ncbi:MAG: 50S ribosomal protein L28 [Bacillota bacterium]|nr:50S ribosomal protein L28 [Bacillota bacterium]HHU30258.1 50S ribosomal protein L28 [Bacillota bacterium]
MSRKCFVCGKGSETGFSISHSHIKTKRTWKANVQRIKALINGTPRRVNVCTRCLKTGKIKRAI